jgi:flagellar M-ring protein FliF
MNEYWQGLDPRARFRLILGVAFILLATIGLGVWTMRADYQVLFADLAPQDAATLVTELDRLKIPYRLSGAGTTILVPADVVYKTRLKLVGKDLPLRGAVGFELFNDSEVGMTEFSQRVNYQRALQGELTRTILSLDEVQAVRVHLVMSEQALFKKMGTPAKASITLTLKPGKAMDASQIQGIQRLVGAAVPNIKPDDVTIVDQHGVALTRRNGSDGEEGSMNSSAALDDKRAIEAYLNKKVIEVLDRMFGAGQGIASVDVTLTHEHTKVTTENVLGANPGGDGPATGVIVRERQTGHNLNGENEGLRTPVTAPVNNGLSTQETDYQVGRRVEQVVSAAGSIGHINVAVVVRKTLDQAQLDRLKEVVALAAGISKTRGDAVAVYSVEQINSTSGSAVVPAATSAIDHDVAKPGEPASALPESAASTASPANEPTATYTEMQRALLLIGALVILIFALIWYVKPKSETRKPLSDEERERLLAQVRDWLHRAPTPVEPN